MKLQIGKGKQKIRKTVGFGALKAIWNVDEFNKKG